jgi:argininosuccinate lyase
MKLWQKSTDAAQDVTRFTAGQDQYLDLFLARYDVLGSIAHCIMLDSIGLLRNQELRLLRGELSGIFQKITEGQFEIEAGVEDVHSQIELMVTRVLGDVGKKIHTGRSRNDQVLVDVKLFLRAELEEFVLQSEALFHQLQRLSEQHRQHLLPGYTHLQLAMPSSFGLWFGAYAESLVDDLVTLEAAYRVVNKNPLGSGAGYGSSFPLDRKLTTQLLGFEDLNYNVVYAQMGRGKTERVVSMALSNLAATLGKMAMDCTLYLNPHFNFISFPDELTTGSSIMPHKKNPDVWELIRARCNRFLALPNEIQLAITNLPSGYHRDLQLVKEILFPALQELKSCLAMTRRMLESIRVNENILAGESFTYLFSVEEVNRRVLAGIPFRDAYRQVGLEIEAGNFAPDRRVHHTHEGSIGNLSNDAIANQFNVVRQRFPFEQVRTALRQLVDGA